jgi:hypothetical protein
MERNWRRIGFGLVLVVVGLLMLGDRFGYLPGPILNYRWWGLLVSLLGVTALVRPRRASDVGNGVGFVLYGIWFLLVSTHAYGFTWSNSWPLALVAAGAGTVAQAIACRWLPDTPYLRRRDRHA